MRNGRILALIFVCLAIVFIYGYVQRAAAAAELQAQIHLMEGQIEEANFRTAELEAELRFAASDDFLDKIAREELGLAKPGETALIILEAPTRRTDGEVDNPILNQISPTGASTGDTSPAILRSATPDLRPAESGHDRQPPWQAWLDLFSVAARP